MITYATRIDPDRKPEMEARAQRAAKKFNVTLKVARQAVFAAEDVLLREAILRIKIYNAVLNHPRPVT